MGKNVGLNLVQKNHIEPMALHQAQAELDGGGASVGRSLSLLLLFPKWDFLSFFSFSTIKADAHFFSLIYNYSNKP